MISPITYFLGIGSNQGDKTENLQSAIAQIHQRVGKIMAISRVYSSAAWGFSGAGFLNAALEVRSRLQPEQLLAEILQIEEHLGRTRRKSGSYEDRPIDIDILLADQIQIFDEHLKVPHPGIPLRGFVLKPLNDIASEALHPGFGKKIKQLVAAMENSEGVLLSEEVLKKPSEPDFGKFRYIAVEGNIGAGKTSLASMIAQDFNAKLILERFKDNAFLPKFYEDQARYAFPLEMSFLADRYQQLSDDLAQYDLFSDFVVSDYDVFKSLIFAQITLQPDEYSLYHKLFNLMYKELVKPDLYIYLYQSTERLLQNIKKRGRSYEQNIQADYLVNINKSYLSFIRSQQELNVRVIDISDLDFVQNREDYLDLLNQIVS